MLPYSSQAQKVWISREAVRNYEMRYDSLHQQNQSYQALHAELQQQIREQQREIDRLTQRIKNIREESQQQQMDHVQQTRIWRNEYQRQSVLMSGMRAELERRRIHITLSRDAKVGYLALSLTLSSVTILAILATTN